MGKSKEQAEIIKIESSDEKQISSPRLSLTNKNKGISKTKLKAAREKARRDRINERFQELSVLCDPEEPKTEKAAILLDAIRAHKALKIEINNLQELNKYLEEKISQYELERSQVLYHQQSLLFNRMNFNAHDLYQMRSNSLDIDVMKFSYDQIPSTMTMSHDASSLQHGELLNDNSDHSMNRHYNDNTWENDNFPPAA